LSSNLNGAEDLNQLDDPWSECDDEKRRQQQEHEWKNQLHGQLGGPLLGALTPLDARFFSVRPKRLRDAGPEPVGLHEHRHECAHVVNPGALRKVLERFHTRFAGPRLGALRVDDFKFQFFQQPYGWPGEKNTTDMPTVVNLRQDPFERTPSIRGESLNDMGGGYMNDFFGREFWRFVLVQQKVTQLAQTAIEYPPMQAPASFNLDAVKREIEEKIKMHAGQ